MTTLAQSFLDIAKWLRTYSRMCARARARPRACACARARPGLWPPDERALIVARTTSWRALACLSKQTMCFMRPNSTLFKGNRYGRLGSDPCTVQRHGPSQDYLDVGKARARARTAWGKSASGYVWESVGRVIAHIGVRIRHRGEWDVSGISSILSLL